jgi:hypothetical protein
MPVADIEHAMLVWLNFWIAYCHRISATREQQYDTSSHIKKRDLKLPIVPACASSRLPSSCRERRRCLGRGGTGLWEWCGSRCRSRISQKGHDHVEADIDGLIPGRSSAWLRGRHAFPHRPAAPGLRPAARARIPTIAWTGQPDPAQLRLTKSQHQLRLAMACGQA